MLSSLTAVRAQNVYGRDLFNSMNWAVCRHWLRCSAVLHSQSKFKLLLPSLRSPTGSCNNSSSQPAAAAAAAAAAAVAVSAASEQLQLTARLHHVLIGLQSSRITGAATCA
jgi:hypothetical protein